VPVDVLPTAPVHHLRRPFFVPVGVYGGGVDFTLDVPAGGAFQGDVGLGGLPTSVGLLQQTAGIRLSLSVLTPDGLHPVASVELAPDPGGERRWQPLAADLSPWAGQRVTLRIGADATTPLAQPTIAWLGSPRIIVSRSAP
jgi:hypothetical protein